MTELVWMEINKSDHMVQKRKSFRTEKELERYIQKLMEKDNFVRILAMR